MKPNILTVNCPTCGRIELQDCEYFFDAENDIFNFPLALFSSMKAARKRLTEMAAEMYGMKAELVESIKGYKSSVEFCHLGHDNEEAAAVADEFGEEDLQLKYDTHMLEPIKCWALHIPGEGIGIEEVEGVYIGGEAE